MSTLFVEFIFFFTGAFVITGLIESIIFPRFEEHTFLMTLTWLRKNCPLYSLI